MYAICGGVFRCIYTRAETFLCIFMNIGAFLENISPKERKTLDFSVYVCHAGIVKVTYNISHVQRCRKRKDMHGE